jgi:hypothetical protein
MWRFPALSWLRQMSLFKGRALGKTSIKRSPGEENFRPMSDRELAVAIRQFKDLRSK